MSSLKIYTYIGKLGPVLFFLHPEYVRPTEESSSLDDRIRVFHCLMDNKIITPENWMLIVHISKQNVCHLSQVIHSKQRVSKINKNSIPELRKVLSDALYRRGIDSKSTMVVALSDVENTSENTCSEFCKTDVDVTSTSWQKLSEWVATPETSVEFTFLSTSKDFQS